MTGYFTMLVFGICHITSVCLTLLKIVHYVLHIGYYIWYPNDVNNTRIKFDFTYEDFAVSAGCHLYL